MWNQDVRIEELRHFSFLDDLGTFTEWSKVVGLDLCPRGLNEKVCCLGATSA